MADNKFTLLKAPIIEAVLDIDCDMPPGKEISTLEPAAHEKLRPEYPKVRRVFVQTHQIETPPGQPPKLKLHQAVHGLQFLSEDEKQLVQFRAQGFSFNRLAHYTSLDDYLPEIQRTWQIFVAVAAPVQIRSVRLRYINRIMLPMPEKSPLQLEEFLKVCPRLPDEGNLTFTGFLNQHTAMENGTGNQVHIVLTNQPPENNILPLILDITAENNALAEVENWPCLLARIQALRDLKNRVFRNTLTEKCLNQFQQP